MKILLNHIARMVLVLLVLSPTVLYAQWRTPDPPDTNLPDLEDIGDVALDDILMGLASLALGVDEESPLTTSLADAKTECPFLDDFNPQFLRMERLERGPNGGFIPRPGFWRMDVRSYCLHAGTHGPGQGNGYLYAPLRGQRAGVIRNIMRNSYWNPDIPQRDVQCLIWGILSRTSISDMSDNLVRAASLLLSPEEIRDLNGSALDIVPAAHWNTVFDSLGVSSNARHFLEVEAGIRSQLTGGSYAFNEIERLAVLTGEPDSMEGDRNVPEGRWSYHPQGYFIRYEPHGYSTTTIEISIPHYFYIEWDELGRVTVIDDQYGRRLEIGYSDSEGPLTSQNPGIASYEFKSIRFERDRGAWGGSGPVININNRGWTLVGSEPGIRAAGEQNLWASNHYDELTQLCGDAIGLPVVFKLGLLANAIQEIQGDPDDPLVEFIKEAWQDKLLWVMHVNQPEEIFVADKDFQRDVKQPEPEEEEEEMQNGDPLEEGFDLSGDDEEDDEDEGDGRGGGDEAGGEGSAAPGNQGRQRLGISSSDADDDDDGEDDWNPDWDPDYEPPGPDDPGYDDYTNGWNEGYLQGWEDAGQGWPEDSLPVLPLVGSQDHINGYYDGWMQGFSDCSGIPGGG